MLLNRSGERRYTTELPMRYLSGVIKVFEERKTGETINNRMLGICLQYEMNRFLYADDYNGMKVPIQLASGVYSSSNLM